jgi:Ca2+/Na+ antiporter
VTDRIVLPALINISKKYGLSRDLTGIIVAIGNLIPETTTTILSFFRHGVKLTEFAIAVNVGGSVFIITVVPALAMLTTYGIKSLGGLAA